MADKKTLPNILDYFDKDNNLDKSSFINAFSDIQGYADLKNYDSTGLADFVNYDGDDITSAIREWSNNSNFGDTRSLGDYLSSYFIDAYETPMSYLNRYNEVLSNNPNDPILEFFKLEADKSNDYLNYFFIFLKKFKIVQIIYLLLITPQNKMKHILKNQYSLFPGIISEISSLSFFFKFNISAAMMLMSHKSFSRPYDFLASRICFTVAIHQPSLHLISVSKSVSGLCVQMLKYWLSIENM